MTTEHKPWRNRKSLVLPCVLLFAMFAMLSDLYAVGNVNRSANYGHEPLIILYPSNESTVFDNDGEINVQIAVSPETNFAARTRIELFFDGKRIQRQKDGAFVLSNVDSGWHRLRARIVAHDGAIITNASSVEFFKWGSDSQKTSDR